MQLYIHIDNPQTLIALPVHWRGRENWGLNASPAEIIAEGFRPYTSAAAPEGERIVTSHIEHDGERSWLVIDKTVNIAEEQSAAEAARIGTLAQTYGQLVGTLAQALSAFGLAMPITAFQALPQVYARYKADPLVGPEVDLLQSAYAVLQSTGLSDDDIYAVAKTIGVAS